MALHVDMAVGESLVFDNGRIKVSLESKAGAKARVSIEADRSINIEKVRRIDHEAVSMGLKDRK